MDRIAFLWIFLFAVASRESLFSTGLNGPVIACSIINVQDTLKNNQILYTGRVWSNKYHRIDGDQFLFADYFLPGTVSINGKTFRNLMLRYDIHNDELMIPVSREEILQLNKEMIDSFSLRFENKTYKFSNIRNDSINGLTGYYNVLYHQQSALYIKYRKEISPNITDESDGEFIQTHITYLVKDNVPYKIKTRNNLYRALNADIHQIRNYLKNDRLKISKKIPESYVPVIRFCDNLKQ